MTHAVVEQGHRGGNLVGLSAWLRYAGHQGPSHGSLAVADDHRAVTLVSSAKPTG